MHFLCNYKLASPHPFNMYLYFASFNIRLKSEKSSVFCNINTGSFKFKCALFKCSMIFLDGSGSNSEILKRICSTC